MFRSLDHPQGATLFLAKVTSKTFIKFLYINTVSWQHVVLCKIALLGNGPGYGVRRVLRGERLSPRNTRRTPLLGAFPVTQSYTTRHAATTPC